MLCKGCSRFRSTRTPEQHVSLQEPVSHTQLVGLGQDHFQHWHEGGGLAEVASADYVGVDVQPLCVVPVFNAPGNVVQAIDYRWGQLEGKKSNGKQQMEKVSVAHLLWHQKKAIYGNQCTDAVTLETRRRHF